MARKYIDCREMPSEFHCSVAIVADNEDELMEVAVDHAVRRHGHADSTDLRNAIRQHMHDGTPPA